MTISAPCRYGTERERAVVDYLYGAGDPDDRRQFETHLTECTVCRTDIASLRGVRQALAEWAPPEPMRALTHAGPTVAGPRLAGPAPVPPGAHAMLATLPTWAKAAAAVLCVGIGLGAANLRVTYSPDGLAVRTGWLSPSPATAPASAPADNPAAVEPWRAELTALESSLRAELQGIRTAAVSHTPPASHDDEAVMRQVRALLARSEQRQQSELALRIGDVLNDVQTQRRADLSRIERTIGVVQNNTGMEVMRQREMLNTLAVRVSSQR